MIATLEKVCERLLVEGALDKMSLLLNLNQPQDVTAFGLEVLNTLVEAGKLNLKICFIKCTCNYR